MTTPQAPETPVEQAKTSRITLSASGMKLTLMAVRRPDGTATTFAVTTDDSGKTSRGMSVTHPTFDAAKTTIEKDALAATKLGWSRPGGAKRGFVARLDAFSTIPPAPKAKSKK
jgi:hypothetical protein